VSVVRNTGPLIAPAKADALAVLKGLFTTVAIPPAVHRELLAKSGPEAVRLDEALRDHVQVVPLPPPSPDPIPDLSGLGASEQQAIALALASGSILVIDDRLGRSAARRLGITVTGTVGVLVRAKQVGIIPSVMPILDQIRRDGYWLSDALMDQAANLSGET
jgi:predicted nucleic acid-binding protein